MTFWCDNMCSDDLSFRCTKPQHGFPGVLLDTAVDWGPGVRCPDSSAGDVDHCARVVVLAGLPGHADPAPHLRHQQHSGSQLGHPRPGSELFQNALFLAWKHFEYLNGHQKRLLFIWFSRWISSNFRINRSPLQCLVSVNNGRDATGLSAKQREKVSSGILHGVAQHSRLKNCLSFAQTTNDLILFFCVLRRWQMQDCGWRNRRWRRRREWRGPDTSRLHHQCLQTDERGPRPTHRRIQLLGENATDCLGYQGQSWAGRSEFSEWPQKLEELVLVVHVNSQCLVVDSVKCAVF